VTTSVTPINYTLVSSGSRLQPSTRAHGRFYYGRSRPGLRPDPGCARNYVPEMKFSGQGVSANKKTDWHRENITITTRWPLTSNDHYIRWIQCIRQQCYKQGRPTQMKARGVTLGGDGRSGPPPFFGEGDGPPHFLRPLGSKILQVQTRCLPEVYSESMQDYSVVNSSQNVYISWLLSSQFLHAIAMVQQPQH